MTRAPEREPWDDAAIDRALREAVSVDPSPAFRARLRARLEHEPVPAAGRAWLAWPGLAAALAGAMLALSPGWYSDWRRVPALPQDVPSPVHQADAAEPATRPAEVHSGAGASRRAPRPVGRGQEIVPAVRAQFDPGEREAFRWFLVLTAEGEMPAPATLAAVTGEGDVVVTPIEIPAIDVPPAVVADMEEGEPRS